MSDAPILTRPEVPLRRTQSLPPRRATPEQSAWVRRVLSVDDAPNGTPGIRIGAQRGAPRPDETDQAVVSEPTAGQAAQAVGAVQQQATAGVALLGGLPDNDDAALALRDILTEHKNLVEREAAVFQVGKIALTTLDDVARIGTSEARAAKFEEIEKVLAAVAQRRTDLSAAIKKLAARKLTGEAAEALEHARVTLSTIDSHLPDDFQHESAMEMRRRLPTLCATKDQKKAILAEAKSGFKDENGKDITGTMRDVFAKGIEKIGTRSFDRQNFYFDAVTTALTPKDATQIYALTDKIADQGQRILDASGSLRDVQELMAKTGIPEDWWPPRLVENLQAWRKTERALAEERVREMKPEKLPNPDDAESVLKFLLSSLPEAGAQVAEIFKGQAVADAVSGVLKGINDGFGLGDVGFTALKSGDFSTLKPKDRKELLDKIDKALESLSSTIEGAISGLKVASDVAGTLAAHASAVIPGLSIAACGVDLAIAVKHLAEHGTARVQTQIMEKDAVKALGNASMTDGGAFIRALGNEIHGRNKQVTQDGIEVFKAGANLGGAIAGTVGGHYGLVVQAGLKVGTTAISFGQRVIFTGIDWSEANRAKKLLEEARAGNPVARVEIFEKSNLYAKMYICLLCRDGNPLAIKFVQQRGIEETDLDTSMSLKILREALLDSADQKDERDVRDGFVREQLGTVGDAIVGAGKKLGELGRWSAEAIKDKTKNRKIKYDNAWSFTGDVQLTQAHWNEVKKQAIAAGLFDYATGIGDGLAAVEKALKAIAVPLEQAEKKETIGAVGKDRATLQAKFSQALAALSAARATVDRCVPGCNPDGDKPHAGMASYLPMLSSALLAKHQEVSVALRQLGLQDTNWKPSGGSPPLDPKAWRDDWADAVEKAMLPNDDAGIGAALDAVAKAEAALEKAGGDAQAARKARQALFTALQGLIGCAKACRGQARGVPGMLDRIASVLTEASKRSVAVDKELAPDDWKNAPKRNDPAKPEEVSAELFGELWSSAVAAGACAPNDGGLLKALREMELRRAAVAQAESGKPKLKARQDFALAVGKVILARDKLKTTQRDIPKRLLDFADQAVLRANQLMSAYDEQRAEVAFFAVGTATAEGWQRTYANAVDSGAVPPAKAAAKALQSALEAYESALSDMQSAIGKKDFKKARAKAQDAVKALDAAVIAIDGKVMGADGYAANRSMSAYLTRLRTDLEAKKAAPPLSEVLAGKSPGSTFRPTAFTMDSGDFSKVKKLAEDNGVIDDKLTTGVSGALKTCKESLASYKKQRGSRSPTAIAIAAAQERAIADAKTLGKAVDGLKSLSENPAWQDYVTAAAKVVAEYEATLAAGRLP
jgi:hypothetical protein